MIKNIFWVFLHNCHLRPYGSITRWVLTQELDSQKVVSDFDTALALKIPLIHWSLTVWDDYWSFRYSYKTDQNNWYMATCLTQQKVVSATRFLIPRLIDICMVRSRREWQSFISYNLQYSILWWFTMQLDYNLPSFQSMDVFLVNSIRTTINKLWKFSSGEFNMCTAIDGATSLCLRFLYQFFI